MRKLLEINITVNVITNMGYNKKITKLNHNFMEYTVSSVKSQMTTHLCIQGSPCVIYVFSTYVTLYVCLCYSRR